ncbi:MAG TPA: hypothetical protein VK184_06890 [Nostocaceae cyanobacterium]|nr:hypothetical protein [Nostocaceae cyanobacterium]
MKAQTVPGEAERVPYCQALTLAGNAYNQNSCTNLSDPSQDAVVCEFGLNNGRDIHSTFRPINPSKPANQQVPLHISVYQNGASKGLSYLAGVWPPVGQPPNQRKLSIAPGNLNIVDGVDLLPYVQRLNNVNAEYGCKASFVQAGAQHQQSQAWITGFADKCKRYNCG